MNNLVVDVKDIKKALNFSGTLKAFKASKELVDYLISNKKIVNVHNPRLINKSERVRYTYHLVELVKNYCEPKGIKMRDDFLSDPKVSDVVRVLNEFGAVGEYFINLNVESEQFHFEESDTSLEDIYDVAEVYLGFKGSQNSLKTQIQSRYGSLAEFCLEFDLPINATAWEKPGTAIRVAKKIGSLSRVRLLSPSLFNFLDKENLLADLDIPEEQVDVLIKSILKYICESEEDLYSSIIEQWFLPNIDSRDLLEDIPDVISKLKDSLCPLELGILYHDLQRVEAESENQGAVDVVESAYRSWSDKMITYNAQSLIFSKRPFHPNSESQAIGYLLFQMIAVDGHIHHDEISEFRNFLKESRELSSRAILAAVNFSLHNSPRNSILDFESLLGRDDVCVSSIEKSCEFLKLNSSEETKNQLLELLSGVMKADNYVHKQEEWLYSLVASYFEEDQAA